ncbi:MAG: 23S rRNA (guanosine(2251)-2'-O)-methyltransferase RlmB [Firmicutes bacterium]|nr:23S rRNA (guanosine(2251)-2'-O)-methyltransferase RlmB [Bacillota bacterium]
MKTEIICGRNPVLEALRSGRQIQRIVILRGSKGGAIDQIQDLAQKRRIPVDYASKSVVEGLATETSHQGVVAQVAPFSYWALEDLLDTIAHRQEVPFLVVLDQIEDPHNLGAVLRSADAAGAHGVIIPQRRAASVTSTVAKTSAGAVEYVPVCQVTNLARAIDTLKERGIWVTGADMRGDKLHTEADLTGPLALVIGSEGRGIRRLIADKCDFLVRLPMYGQVNSLNASVAAGILLYEAVRQRRGL